MNNIVHVCPKCQSTKLEVIKKPICFYDSYNCLDCGWVGTEKNTHKKEKE